MAPGRDRSEGGILRTGSHCLELLNSIGLSLWAEEAVLFLPVSWPLGSGALALPPQNTGLGEDGLWWKPAQDASAQWGNGRCHLRGTALGLDTVIGILRRMVKCTRLVMKATGLHRFVSNCIQA